MAREGTVERIHRLLGRSEEAVTDAVVRAKKLTGQLREIEVVPYGGFGAGNRAILQGRVLEKKQRMPSTAEDTWQQNLKAISNRFLTVEIPRAHTQVNLQGQDYQVVADSEGYLHLDVELPTPLPAGWSPFEVQVVESLGGRSETAQGELLTPPAESEYIIVSDVDDTILPTYVTDSLRMLRTVLLSNEHTRLPFPGVAELYAALQQGQGGGARNPIFYLSKSPWNFYDLLTRFMEINDVPRGPLLLRDFGFSRKRPPKERVGHKLEQLQLLLELYQHPFVLIGDCGEKDPAVYAMAACDHPGQVRAIFIRCPEKVPSEAREYARRAAEAGSSMHFVRTTREAATKAQEMGLVSQEAAAAIGLRRQ